MNLSETKNPKLKNRMFIELAMLAIAFVLCYLLPFCEFYYLNDDENETVRTVPQYASDFKIAYLFAVNFGMMALAMLSLNRVAALVINILVIAFSLLLFVFIQLGFAWWGVSPFHPNLDIGYWFTHLLLLILLIRSFAWRSSFTLMPAGKVYSGVMLALTIAVPLLLVLFVARSINKEKNRPVKRSEFWPGERAGRIIKEESWDYLEAYDAFADKYYSRNAADSNGIFRLDSVRFSFFEKRNITKRFTRKAINGKLDIEDILDSN